MPVFPKSPFSGPRFEISGVKPKIKRKIIGKFFLSMFTAFQKLFLFLILYLHVDVLSFFKIILENFKVDKVSEKDEKILITDASIIGV